MAQTRKQRSSKSTRDKATQNIRPLQHIPKSKPGDTFSLESQRMMIRLDFEFPANRMMLDCWAFGPSTARGNIEKKRGTFPFDPENASILTIQKPITTIAVWPQIPLYLGAFIFLLPHTVNISFSRHGLRVKGHLSACPHDL